MQPGASLYMLFRVYSMENMCVWPEGLANVLYVMVFCLWDSRHILININWYLTITSITLLFFKCLGHFTCILCWSFLTGQLGQRTESQQG